MNSMLQWARRSALALAALAPVALAVQSPAPAPAPPPAPAPAPSTPVQAPVKTTQAPSTGITTSQPPVQTPPAPAPAPGDHPHPHPAPGVQDPQIPNAPPDPKVRLECAKVEHDFGAMTEGEIARHTFEMQNTGENPLIIVSAKPSCGCTVSHVKVEGDNGEFAVYTYGAPILAGKRVQIEAELNTRGKKNVAQSKINVMCNDPRQVVTLGLTANVDLYFASTPPELNFGDMSTSDTREMTAIITAKRGGKFKLTQEVATAVKGIKVELKAIEPQADGSSERWEVKVTMGPDCSEGNMGYPVQLRSDQLVPGSPIGADGRAPAFGASVLIQARVKGLISFVPQYLSFGLVRPGQQLTRTLKIESNDEKFLLSQPKSMRFAGQSDSVPEFRWADNFELVARPAADGKTMDVDVVLKGMPEGSDSSFQGRVMIETGHPARPMIAVLFSGVCRSGSPLPPTPAPAPAPGPAPIPTPPVKGNQ